MLEAGFEPRYLASGTCTAVIPRATHPTGYLTAYCTTGLCDRNWGDEHNRQGPFPKMWVNVRLAFSLPEWFGSEETFFNKDDALRFPLSVTLHVSIPPLNGPWALMLATAIQKAHHEEACPLPHAILPSESLNLPPYWTHSVTFRPWSPH